MKKIIDNKLYNTDTAKKLGSWENTWDYRDFNHIAETLYQKRTGEYFLHGDGGPMTKYAVSVSNNSWRGGEQIIPLSSAKAREWAEEHLDTDDYAEIFGMPNEGEDTVALNIQIDAALMARLRQMASDEGITLTACVEKQLRKSMG